LQAAAHPQQQADQGGIAEFTALTLHVGSMGREWFEQQNADGSYLCVRTDVTLGGL
jgi:hypothetical protein